jgi:hypothetical protein
MFLSHSTVPRFIYFLNFIPQRAHFIFMLSKYAEFFTLIICKDFRIIDGEYFYIMIVKSVIVQISYSYLNFKLFLKIFLKQILNPSRDISQIDYERKLFV